MVDYAQNFGSYLRFIREEVYKESLREFGRRTEFSSGYLGKLELAQVGVPRRATVTRLAEKLEIAPDILLMKAGYTPDEPGPEAGSDAISLKFRRLTPEAQDMVTTIIDALVAKYTNK